MRAAASNVQPKDIAIATGASDNCDRRTIHAGQEKDLTQRVWGRKGPCRKIQWVALNVMCVRAPPCFHFRLIIDVQFLVQRAKTTPQVKLNEQRNLLWKELGVGARDNHNIMQTASCRIYYY